MIGNRKIYNLQEMREQRGGKCPRCECEGPHDGNRCRHCGRLLSLRSRGRPPISEDDQNRIRRLIEINTPVAEVAKLVGASRPTIYKYLKKLLGK